MGQEVITFIFAWIFSAVLIEESKTSTGYFLKHFSLCET